MGEKAEAVFAHRLIKLSVGGAGHNIGRAGQPGEGFGNDLFNGFIGFAVYVDGLCEIVGVDDLRLKTVLFCKAFDYFKAFSFRPGGV